MAIKHPEVPQRAKMALCATAYKKAIFCERGTPGGVAAVADRPGMAA